MIDIKYILKENDFLLANLYYYKTEGKLKKIILKTWALYTVIMTILVGIMLLKKETFISLIFLFLYIILSMTHSGRIKNVYFKNFQKSMKAYENRFNKEVKLKFSVSQLHIESVMGTTDFNISQIDSIAETKNHFFIKLRPDTIIIPKSSVEHLVILKNDIVSIAEKLNLKFHQDTEWKW